MKTEEWTRLCESAPVLLDGAWGTELQARGLSPGEGAEGWNLTHPEEVEDLAASYVRAGSRIILTNTFGGSRIMLERHGQGDRAAEINRAGAERSRRAADTKALVFGSIGPTGKMLMMGDISPEAMHSAFEEQAQALCAGGVDGLVIETMADIEEAALAVRAAVSTGLPVVACMIYDSGPEKDRTMMGNTLEQAAEILQEAGAWAIGSNCGQGPDGFVRLCERYRKATDLPLWMKPNAGLPEWVDGKAVYRVSPRAFAEAAQRLVDAGATFIGGCCGTAPAFINALSEEWK